LLDLLTLESSSADTRLLKALEVVHQHQRSRRKLLDVTLDLGFASQRWQAFVQQRYDGEVLLDRHALELCVFMYLAEALQSGDVYVVGSGAYDDYRTQLLPWDECDRRLGEYGAAVKLPTEATGFVAELREKLDELEKNSLILIAKKHFPNLYEHSQFYPYHFGPYSTRFAVRVNQLKDDQIISASYTGRNWIYSLSDKGIKRWNEIKPIKIYT